MSRHGCTFAGNRQESHLCVTRSQAERRPGGAGAAALGAQAHNGRRAPCGRARGGGRERGRLRALPRPHTHRPPRARPAGGKAGPVAPVPRRRPFCPARASAGEALRAVSTLLAPFPCGIFPDPRLYAMGGCPPVAALGGRWGLNASRGLLVKEKTTEGPSHFIYRYRWPSLSGHPAREDAEVTSAAKPHSLPQALYSCESRTGSLISEH